MGRCWALLVFKGKTHYLEWMYLTLCFSEKLPAAGNITFIFRGQ